MNLKDANLLLDAGDTDLESGYRWLDDGQFHAGFLLGLYARETGGAP